LWQALSLTKFMQLHVRALRRLFGERRVRDGEPAWLEKKARSQIMVADGAGGVMKLEDRRFEKGDWPINFEIPVAGEQPERW
jgi:hypothetical protein